MLPRVIPLAVLLGATAALAGDLPASGWREALAAEFEATHPPATPSVAVSSPLRPGVPIPVFEDDDPEVVRLPTMSIAAHRTHRDLAETFERRYAAMRPNELTWKGGPLIEKKFGSATIGVYSILYIPVLVRGEIRF